MSFARLSSQAAQNSGPSTHYVQSTFAHSSSTRAIHNAHWDKDTHTILFLGTDDNGAQHLYRFNILTGKLKPMTHESIQRASSLYSEDAMIYIAAGNAPYPHTLPLSHPSSSALRRVCVHPHIHSAGPFPFFLSHSCPFSKPRGMPVGP